MTYFETLTNIYKCENCKNSVINKNTKLCPQCIYKKFEYHSENLFLDKKKHDRLYSIIYRNYGENDELKKIEENNKINITQLIILTPK